METSHKFEAQQIENQGGIFRHILMQQVWTARDYHRSSLVPKGGV